MLAKLFGGRLGLALTLACAPLLFLTGAVGAQTLPGEVKSNLKISSGLAGLPPGLLADTSQFGRDLADLGDLDGDGFHELAVGAPFDGSAGPERGAVWILFPRCDGRIHAWMRITEGQGSFGGTLDDADLFGISVASLGDVDGDGFDDLAVGAHRDDDGGDDRGAVWVLFLRADGSVKEERKISDTAGGFTGVLADESMFGFAAAGLGDVDGDDVPDLAAASRQDEEPGVVWILFLNSNGTVKSHARIDDASLGGVLGDFSDFAFDLAGLGLLDGDDVPDLAVGDPSGQCGGPPWGCTGSVWVLFLNADGSVASHQEIAEGIGGFTGDLDVSDRFGLALGGVDDVDGDGIDDLAVGAPLDDDGGFGRGAVWVLFMNQDGTVKGHRKISDTAGHFTGQITSGEWFGQAVVGLGDLDGDGTPELVIGAPSDSWPLPGNVWTAFLTGGVTGPWVDQGDMFAGSTHCPRLTGSGSLQAGTPVEVNLEVAAPSSLAVLLVGLSEQDLAWFYGGVLVPAPDIVVGPLGTDATGGLLAAGSWPADVPSGFQAWLQIWIADLGAPFGYAASNGLLIVAP